VTTAAQQNDLQAQQLTALLQQIMNAMRPSVP
jgi:hypothetical protein